MGNGGEDLLKQAEKLLEWKKNHHFDLIFTELTRFLFLLLSLAILVLRIELYSKTEIINSKRISNPGCFATNTQILLAPLLPYIDPSIQPTIFGISGYSGAGTKSGSVPKISPADLIKGEGMKDPGIRVYSLTDHIHEREAGHHLSTLLSAEQISELEGKKSKFSLAFIPSVSPWFSGILSTLSVPLKKEMRSAEIREIFEKFFAGEKLVQVGMAVPEVGEIAGKNGVKIGGFQVHSEGKRVVIVVCSFLFFDQSKVTDRLICYRVY